VDVQIRFAPSGRTLRVPAGTTLLDAIRAAGLPAASACGAQGLCARCGVRVLAGGQDLPAEGADETDAKRRNRVPGELRLACRIAPRANLEVTASYW
jgi:adenylate cyclase